MDNSIIIIGGMGPQASIHLHQLVLDGSKAHHNGAPDEYPAITHLSIPVPDFISSPLRYSEALGLVQRVCGKLPLKRASAVGIACNTAHLMVADLPFASDVPFVSMIDAAADQAKATGNAKIGVLASPHTIATGLYERALVQRGLTTINPHDDELHELDAIIHAVIEGRHGPALRRRLSTIAKKLEARGANCLLLGCTELPLVGVNSNLPVVNSLQALADQLLKQHYQESCIL